ncbi:MAG: xanthine dehydrogenase family protein subunit M [Clostridiales bacterium]|nr:xanthine dehydrogenase family protein subunit M [Clostridiales bacterium]
MKSFNYVKAPDLGAALAVLDREGEKACLVAGGTNVMVDIRAGKLNDLTLVGITDIADLRGIRLGQGKITVGALTTINELAQSDVLAKQATALYMSANVFADALTRNSATIGGNIAYASPAADTAPALLALQAEVLIESKGGQRRVALAEFFSGVNKTVLLPSEMITAIEFAPSPQSAFLKIGLRNAMAISVATAACAVQMGRGGVINDCAIALGSVAHTPLRAYETEKLLCGQKVGEHNLTQALEALQKTICPIDDIRATGHYRREVAPVLVKRALFMACGIQRSDDKKQGTGDREREGRGQND